MSQARWDRLARMGELTPHDGDAFADTVAAHRLAMHSLGAARLSRFDPTKVRVRFRDRAWLVPPALGGPLLA
jgi:hypothetical protein